MPIFTYIKMSGNKKLLPGNTLLKISGYTNSFIPLAKLQHTTGD